MKIRVKGSLKLRGNYEVELDMTEEEFDQLSEREQNEEIETAINWKDWLDNTDLDDIDVDDVEAIDDGE